MEEKYSEFICLSKEMEEKVSKMDDKELDMISSLIAHSMRQTMMKIDQEMREKCNETQL